MLNPEQEQAVNSYGNVCILSGAGTGKTETISRVIKKRIDDGVHPNRIFVSTFTNKAASEMMSRIQKVGVNSVGMIGTFHRNCKRIIHRHEIFAGRSENFRLIDEDEIIAALSSERLDLKYEGNPLTKGQVSKFFNMISLLKAHVISPDLLDMSNLPYVVLKVADGDDILLELLRDGYQKYEDFLRSVNVMDVDDLIYVPVRSAMSNLALRDRLASMFDLVVVDEHQDSNLSQIKMARLLARGGSLVTVGDDGQSIYGWRGAYVHGIREDAHRVGTECILLNRNYRSTPGILRLGDAVLSYDIESSEKTLIAEGDFKDDESLPVLREFIGAQQESDWVAKEIASRIYSGQAPDSIAVLCRTRRMCSSLSSALTKQGIANVTDGINIWSTKVAKFLSAWLSILVYPAHPGNGLLLKSIIQSDIVKYGLGDKWMFSINQAMTGGISFEEAMGNSKKEQALKTCHTTLSQDNIFLNKNVSDINVGEAIEVIIEKTGILETLYSLISDLKEGGLSLKSQEKISVLQGHIERIREIRDLAQGGDVVEFLEQAALGNTKTEPENSVSIMTFHGAKGLEWQTVYACGMSEAMLGTSMAGSPDYYEACRTLYVAVTRAKKDLTLTCASWYYDKPHHTSSIILEALEQGMLEKHGASVEKGWGSMVYDDDF